MGKHDKKCRPVECIVLDHRVARSHNEPENCVFGIWQVRLDAELAGIRIGNALVKGKHICHGDKCEYCVKCMRMFVCM